ncbi:MAG: hypothetical protein H6627_04560 [Calditrichae bacterium]|nr:hypothetical protein [Calditrichia bacterium]
MKVLFFFISIILNHILVDRLRAEDLDYGLDFFIRSSSYPSQATSLDLTINQKLVLPDKYILQFDIQLMDPMQYGVIFNLFNQAQKNDFRLTYDPHAGVRDSAYWILSYNGESELTRLKAPLWASAGWQTVVLTIDQIDKMLRLKIGPFVQSRSFSSMKISDTYNLCYGYFRNNVTPTDMSIRDIKLFDIGKKEVLYHWPLDEDGGNTVRDKIRGIAGVFYNGLLRREAYYKPQKLFEDRMDKYYMLRFSGIDLKRRQMYFWTDKYIYKIFLNGRQIEKISNNPGYTKVPWWNVIDYDNYNRRLIGLYQGHGQVSVYDEITKKWSAVDTTKLSKQYHSIKHFISPWDGSIYILGGYGYYTVKNDLLRYNFEKTKWDTLDYEGKAAFLPRAGLSIVSPGIKENTFYVFGGSGNQSGKQELGFYYLNDLWLLDLNSFRITKLDTIETNNRDINRSFYNPVENKLYFINNPTPSIPAQVAGYDFETKSIQYLDFGDLNISDAFYVPSESMGYLITANETVHEVTCELYRFKLPFKKVIEAEAEQPRLSKLGSVLLFTFSLSVILILLTRKYKKPKTKIFSAEAIEHKTAVNMFGSFSIVHQDKNITLHLSPQIKELLLYFMVKTHFNGGGVTTEIFTTDFWPELDNQKAKNARSSAVKRVRAFLESTEGMEISVTRNLWMLKIKDTVHFDYREFINLRNRLDSSDINREVMERLIRILEKGMLLQDVSYEWLESYKSAFKDDVERFSVTLAKILVQQKDYDVAERLFKLLFSWEPLNENILSYLLNLYLNQNRNSEMLIQFDLFKKQYKQLFDNEYQGSLEKVLKITKK